MTAWHYVYSDREGGQLRFPSQCFVPVDGRPPCGVFTKLWFDGLRGWKISSGAEIALTATECWNLRAFLLPSIGEEFWPAS